MRILFRDLCLRAPRFVNSSMEFTSIDEAFDRAIRFYRSYFSNAKVFDRTNTDAVVGRAASHWNMDEANLLGHIRWYLGHLSSRDCLIDAEALPTSIPLIAMLEEIRAIA
jgi:hypothetical protein